VYTDDDGWPDEPCGPRAASASIVLHAAVLVCILVVACRCAATRCAARH